MRKFYFQFVLFFLAALAGFILMVGLNACAALGEHSAASQLVVSYATQKYIETAAPADQARRATHVREVVNAVSALAENDTVSIFELANFAITKIPTHLSPSDQSLARALIQIAAQELQKKVGATNPDVRVEVKEVLKWIADACEYYSSTPTAMVFHPKVWRV